jgi:hypothetical protein
MTSSESGSLQLPEHEVFVESIAPLMLDISASELHGLL